jgi:signal transduction histidine kinase
MGIMDEFNLAPEVLPLINVLQWTSGLILLLVAAYCHGQRPSQSSRSLILFCILTGAWAALSATIFFQSSLEIAIALNRLKLIVVSLLAPSIMWMVMSIVWQRAMPLWLKILLGLTPAFVFVVNITPWFELYVGGYEFLKVGNYQLLIFKNGPLFEIQSIASRVFIVIAMALIFLRPSERNNIGNLDRLSLFLSLMFPMIADGLSVFYFSDLRFAQITPAFFIVTAAFLAKIILKDRVLDVIPYARSLIVDSSKDLLLVFNQDNKLVDYNQKAQVFFQLTKKDISSNLDLLVKNKPTMGHDYIAADSLIYEREVQSLIDGENKDLGKIFIFKDKTLEKTVQRELEEINSTKTKLLGILGHDIQGHLGAISILTEDLINHRKKIQEQDVLGQLESIYSSTRFSIEFVDELLRWTKADLGSLKVQQLAVNIPDLVDELYRFMLVLFTARDIEFESDIPEDLNIISDPHLIKIIVRNLLSNAIKFSRESSRVRLSVEVFENDIEITVQDWGCGLSQDEIDKLLGMTDAQRSGFGLLASINFAKMLGGEIFAVGAKEKGCRFTLRIPKIKVHEERERAP